MASAMPCKKNRSPKPAFVEPLNQKKNKSKESEEKTRFSCIAEAHESTRQRIDSVRRIHEGQIAGKGEKLPTKRSPNSPKVKARACCFDSRRSVSVGLHSSSNPTSPGSTRCSQEGNREESSTNSGCCVCSASLGKP